MAAGDPYYDSDTCGGANGATLDMLIRDMAVKDSNGNPALRVYDTNASGGGGGSFPSPAVVTPAMSRVTNASSVTAGKRTISIANTGSVNSTVLGAILKPGEVVNFTSSGMNNTLAAIAYDASAVGGELLITTTV